jgi:hypothetical protein
MAVFRPRTRLVSFRLSDDEYEHPRKASLFAPERSFAVLAGDLRPGLAAGGRPRADPLERAAQSVELATWQRKPSLRRRARPPW